MRRDAEGKVVDAVDFLDEVDVDGRGLERFDFSPVKPFQVPVIIQLKILFKSSFTFKNLQCELFVAQGKRRDRFFQEVAGLSEKFQDFLFAFD
jgi:hypothetical protein